MEVYRSVPSRLPSTVLRHVKGDVNALTDALADVCALPKEKLQVRGDCGIYRAFEGVSPLRSLPACSGGPAARDGRRKRIHGRAGRRVRSSQGEAPGSAVLFSILQGAVVSF